MDSDKSNGRANLNKYRKYGKASTSTPSMPSSGTRPPTASTSHPVAPVPVLEALSRKRFRPGNRPLLVSDPLTIAQPQPTQTPKILDLSMDQPRRKPRPPPPTQQSQSSQSAVPVPQIPAIDLSVESLNRKPRPPVPAPPTSARPQSSQTSQSSTPSTNSRSNPHLLQNPFRTPARAPPAPAPFLSTLRTRIQGAQSPVSPPNQPSLQILPLLAVIKDQQTTILTQCATSDRSLRDLVTEVGKLSERAKQRDEEHKERETKDKEKREREKETLKALILMAQKVEDVKKRVVGIEAVVGVGRGHDKTTVLDRLQNIEMDFEEWLERARDPDAAMAVDQRQPLTPSLSPTAPTAPTVVRHEMAVSPIKVSTRNQAVSTRTPEPVLEPKPTLIDVSTQVDTSEEQSTQPSIREVDSLCVSCSNKLHTPSERVFTPLHSTDIDMSDSTASVPSHTTGKEVDRTSMQEGPLSHQVIDDNPFLMQPNVSLPLASTGQATQTGLGPSDKPVPCKHSDQKSKSPSQSRSDSEKSPITSLSPANWTKTAASSASAVEVPSPRGPAVPPLIPPNGNKSYSLPPLPEGTIAALRKEVLVDPYPYPLESAGLGDGNGLVLPKAGVVGASVEAAKRMPSPESQCEEDNVDDDIYDNSGEQSMPEVCNTRPSESKRSHSPSGSLTPQSMARQIAKSTENAPIQPTQITDAVIRRGLSMSTESSLTSLSTDFSASASNVEESSTPRAPSPKQTSSVATLPRPPTLPASQKSNITEDEDTVMTLVMDALPTSPAHPPQSQAINVPVLHSASTLVLVSPELDRTRPISSPQNDDPADKENLTKLQEWYREQRMQVLSKQKTTIVAEPEDHSTAKNNEGNPEKDNSIPYPASPLFTSPILSPLGPEGHSTNQTDGARNEGVSGNGHMSPLFTSPSVTPPKRKGNVVPVRPEPPPYLKKLVETVKDDDDVDIIPLKRNRTSSTTVGSLVGSEKGKEKPILSTPSQQQQPPPKKGLLTTQSKRQPSKAKTRIKKRKVSKEPIKMDVESDDEEEEDQPPLKRVKLRLNKTPSGRNSKTATPVNAKPKSVTIVSPVKTPKRRVRDHQPRTATVAWPKLEDPVFDQFIECDICERWYHVGCVGIHPDDIRLSATEIFRCPPCDAGISKEVLTPVKNTQGNNHDEACARPKCLCPRRNQSVKKETTFTVESFVGVLKKSVGGRGIKLVYLVKWLGYDYKDATWEEEAAMGLPDPSFFVETFEEQARKERIDLSECNNSQAALLRCAIEAGWKRNGTFVKKEA